LKYLHLTVLSLLLMGIPLTFAQAKISHVAQSRTLYQEPLIPVIRPLVATYDVYVGGLHLVTADIFFEERNGKYHTHIEAHTTYGFWSRIFPWKSVLDTVGEIKKDRFIPKEFNTVDDWNHHPKGTKLTFTPAGDVVPTFDPPNKDVNREFVTSDQRRHSLDPITGLLQMLAQVSNYNNCNITVAIFDGKRLFDITGSDKGGEDIDDGEYSIYKGPTHICGAGFKMVAGEWKEKDHIQNGFWQRNDKDLGREPFDIWLAHISPELPELPVRLRGGSVWGLIVMHLTKWSYVK